MKKLPLLLSALAVLAFAGCEKDDTETPETQEPLAYMPATEGSWWAYALYQHDGNGNFTLMSRDTLRLMGETIIGEHTYTTYEGSLLVPYNSSTQPLHVRDSAFHLINEYSQVMLPYLNPTDTFNRVGPEGGVSTMRYQKLYTDTEAQQVTAGTFETIDFRTEVVFQNPSSCETTMGIMHQHFAENVGMVRATYWYASTYGCGPYVERALEAYHIETPLHTHGQ